MDKELLKGKAKFDCIGNDLYWECWLFSCDENNELEFFHMFWIGHKDNFWWENISEKVSTVTCKGDKGTIKKFKLDYKTLVVTEVN